jgi:hypothetical protein
MERSLYNKKISDLLLAAISIKNQNHVEAILVINNFYRFAGRFSSYLSPFWEYDIRSLYSQLDQVTKALPEDKNHLWNKVKSKLSFLINSMNNEDFIKILKLK